MVEISFDLKQFVGDLKSLVRGPLDYFSAIEAPARFDEPVIRAAILGLAAGLFNFIWALAGLVPPGGFFTRAGLGIIVAGPIMAVLLLFAGAGFILLLSMAANGSRDFRSAVGAMAAILVLYPLAALLGFAQGIHFYPGAVVRLLVLLCGVVFIYLALARTLLAENRFAIIIAVVLAILTIITTAHSMYTYRMMVS